MSNPHAERLPSARKFGYVPPMNIRLLFLLGALISCLALGCSGTGPEPTPTPPMNRAGGPPVDEGAPNTGGALFNGN